MQTQPRGAAAGLGPCQALILLLSSFHNKQQLCRSATRPTKVTKLKKHPKQREPQSREHPSLGKGPCFGNLERFCSKKREKRQAGGAGAWWAVGLSLCPLHGAGLWGWSCCWNVRSPLCKIQHRPFLGSLCSGAASKQGTALINVTFMLKTSREAVI